MGWCTKREASICLRPTVPPTMKSKLCPPTMRKRPLLELTMRRSAALIWARRTSTTRPSARLMLLLPNTTTNPSLTKGLLSPTPPPRANQPNQVTVNNAQVFHLVSIIFVLLSLVFSPLLALVPVILFCFMQQDLRQNNDTPLHVIDFVLAVVVTVLWLAFVVVLAVFTFGIGLVFLVFLIPLFILCAQLAS